MSENNPNENVQPENEIANQILPVIDDEKENNQQNVESSTKANSENELDSDVQEKNDQNPDNQSDVKENNDLEDLNVGLSSLKLEENEIDDKIKEFAEILKNSKNVIFMNGAGISTAAGIPDFRSPKTGLYENLDKYNLPDPHLIFELNFFKKDPKPFFSLSKELMPKDYKPTDSHFFQRLLVDKGLVKKIYTQNIDGLESIAKIPDNKIIYAHGSFKSGHCLSCGKEYTFEWMKNEIHEKSYLECNDEECLKSEKSIKKIVKPDIVFFGEQMPDDFFNFRKDFPECDCLIIMGTSLKVQPFSLLPHMVESDCPRLLINRDLVGDWEVYKLRPELNKRDFSLQGTCDDGVWKLVKLLGWENELKDLIKKERD